MCALRARFMSKQEFHGTEKKKKKRKMTTVPKVLFVRPSNCNVFGLNLYEILYLPPLPREDSILLCRVDT